MKTNAPAQIDVAASYEALEKRKSARPLFAFAQALVYLALSIIALEAFFYVAQIGDSEHVQPDRHIGYKPFAGKRITHRKEGFGSFVLNSHGMQNDEVSFAKPVGTYRIAVFGDSYVEALQLPRKDNYLALAAAELRRKTGRDIEILNFGVSNYSVAQDYLRYKTLASKFKPDLVIQAYRVDETAKLLPTQTDCLLFVRPVLFPADGGGTKYDDSCVKLFFDSAAGRNMTRYNWLRGHSRIWEVWSEFYHKFKEESAALVAATKNNFSSLGLPIKAETKPVFELPSEQVRANYTKCYWYMMDAQLREFAATVEKDGGKFMFLRTPTVRVGEHKLLDNPTETALLTGTASQIKASVLDIDKAYRPAFGTVDDGSKFSAGGHFTPPLHRWIAPRLADFIINQGYLQGSSKEKP